MKTHTGKKSYQCNQCPRAFAQGGSLKSHMKTHNEGKSYPQSQVNITATPNSNTNLQTYLQVPGQGSHYIGNQWPNSVLNNYSFQSHMQMPTQKIIYPTEVTVYPIKAIHSPREDTPSPLEETFSPREEMPYYFQETPYPREQTPSSREQTPSPREETSSPIGETSYHTEENNILNVEVFQLNNFQVENLYPRKASIYFTEENPSPLEQTMYPTIHRPYLTKVGPYLTEETFYPTKETLYQREEIHYHRE